MSKGDPGERHWICPMLGPTHWINQPQSAKPHPCSFGIKHPRPDTFAVKPQDLCQTTQTTSNDSVMANLTTEFNALLKGHEAKPTKAFSPETADEFLKEAYRIVRSSPSLTMYTTYDMTMAPGAN